MASIFLHNKDEVLAIPTIPSLETDIEYKKKVSNLLLKFDEATPDTKGINLIVGGWFNLKQFSKPFTLTFLYDRLNEGDKGVLADEVGYIMYTVREHKLIELALLPLLPLLGKLAFKGAIGVQVVVTKDKIYFKDFKVPPFQLLAELLKMPLLTYMKKVLEQDLIEREDFIIGASIGVGLTLHPYPLASKCNAKDQILTFINEGARKHIWYINKANHLGLVTARGDGIKECRRRVYRTINNIVQSKDIQYRYDIGNSIYEAKEDLDRWYNKNASDKDIS